MRSNSLSGLERRFAAAQDHEYICRNATSALAAEAACAACEDIEDESTRVLAEIALKSPLSETAVKARQIANAISDCAAVCRECRGKFQVRARRA